MSELSRLERSRLRKVAAWRTLELAASLSQGPDEHAAAAVFSAAQSLFAEAEDPPLAAAAGHFANELFRRSNAIAKGRTK